MISGAELDANATASSGREGRTAFDGPCTIRFKAERGDNYRLALRRSQPFAQRYGKTVSEIHVVRAFVNVVDGMKEGLDSAYGADLRTAFPRRVVVGALCRGIKNEDAVLGVIDQMAMWAGQQYEGKPIPAAVGFMQNDTQGSVSFRDFCDEKFSAVVSNGFDTLVACNFGGQVIGHETLTAPASPLPFAPYRLAAVADWAGDGRLAIVLNRVGEILVFQDKQLIFARRAGQWHFLTHEPLITQMRLPQMDRVRRAVYETCLDASLARSGACIGVVASYLSYGWERVLGTASDNLSIPRSTKSQVVSLMVGNRRFQELDRRLRAELVALDGATLIDHAGVVLAAGAIVKIQTGSSEGGRLAAAKELSKRGLGIKVSQDGRISGFYLGREEPIFTVM
jgi:hypothetical protein